VGGDVVGRGHAESPGSGGASPYLRRGSHSTAVPFPIISPFSPQFDRFKIDGFERFDLAGLCKLHRHSF
jgi:hypothetical protein